MNIQFQCLRCAGHNDLYQVNHEKNFEHDVMLQFNFFFQLGDGTNVKKYALTDMKGPLSVNVKVCSFIILFSFLNVSKLKFCFFFFATLSNSVWASCSLVPFSQTIR